MAARSNRPSLSEDAKANMTRAVALAVTEFALKGLGSVDFILVADGPLLLEINPRPGATVDIYDSSAPRRYSGCISTRS